MDWPVYLAHSSFIEGSHTTKNTVSGFWTHCQVFHNLALFVSYWCASEPENQLLKPIPPLTHDQHFNPSSQTLNFKASKLFSSNTFLIPFLQFDLTLSIQHNAILKREKYSRPSLRWTGWWNGNNCYALCNLFYICGCKIKVSWTRMPILIYHTSMQSR